MSGNGFFQKAKEALIGRPVEKSTPQSVHISQVSDEVYNSGSTASSANCGPVSAVMAIRLVGGRVPGEDKFRGEDLVLHVRQIATGNTDRWTGTHNFHLQKILEQAGCAWTIHRHPKDMLRRVQAGDPVIMGGNPTNAGAYPERFSYIDVRRWDSGHWIVVSQYIPAKDRYIINDPQSTIGPIEVTADELYAFSSRDGDFGISVRLA